ncbi:type II toxin-antitoxin system RelE/ParE family toxin [Candidatus Pacearchaeota archaeon]|nr:type II toxin-antitoxin system RelE/ParE family toxin [Candidatus Pacearchaeota archaeon]
MAKYKILFKKSAEKELAKIPTQDCKKIVKRIKSLRNEPRPVGTQKLSNNELYRIRQGNYRIVYTIQDNELIIWVIKIGHRREVYRE